MGAEFDAAGPLEVVEDRVGTGSTDFWGISFSPSSTEQDPMDEAELERKLKLLRAAWAFFDGVAARVSPELRKGPRGGGRERDAIIGHVIRVESMDFAAGVGIVVPDGNELIPGWDPGLSRGVRRGHARLQRGQGDAHAETDPAVPDPPLGLPHPRPRLGDGGQGSFRGGRRPVGDDGA